MGRPRREIYSEHVYEICMRTQRGLPFVCTHYMKMLLESVIARVQRDHKVTLCHQLWMGNHPHIFVVAKDKRACTQFYGEIQKQLTEAVKKLCGLKHLSLWNNNATSVIPYYDVETVCYRIAYLYANPARADLVDTISDYPGLSSWHEFLSDKSSLRVTHLKVCPWVRLPMIERLASPAVTREEDLSIVREWETQARDSHALVLQPNAWMKSFGIKTRKEVEETNEKVLRYHTGLELEAREKRGKKKKKVMGKKELRSQPLNLTYQSKKQSRRISNHSLDPELRVYLIEKYQEFCDACRRCYERWKLGDFSVVWPEGAFLPPVPHTQNNLSPAISNVY